MNFTYDSYRQLLKKLKDEDYTITDYFSNEKYEQCAILRHDIDYDISMAYKMAEIEAKEGIHSTYFVLLSSDFYNVFSKNNKSMLKGILDMGHDIGLHYDEKKYPELYGKPIENVKYIVEEAHILGEVLEKDVRVVSMHRPSREILESDVLIPGMINSYSKYYFEVFKYLSDSRRCWKEPIDKIICEHRYRKLHILTHSFWYRDIEESIHDTVLKYIKAGNRNRYDIFSKNITDIDKIVSMEEIK